MAEIIRTSGEIEKVAPKNGKDFDLQELQNIVGGYIELIYLRDKEGNRTDNVIVANECGKLDGRFKLNETATLMAKFENAIDAYDSICGDVLLCKIWEIR